MITPILWAGVHLILLATRVIRLKILPFLRAKGLFINSYLSDFKIVPEDVVFTVCDVRTMLDLTAFYYAHLSA